MSGSGLGANPSGENVGQAFQPDTDCVRLESLTYVRSFRASHPISVASATAAGAGRKSRSGSRRSRSSASSGQDRRPARERSTRSIPWIRSRVRRSMATSGARGAARDLRGRGHGPRLLQRGRVLPVDGRTSARPAVSGRHGPQAVPGGAPGARIPGSAPIPAIVPRPSTSRARQWGQW